MQLSMMKYYLMAPGPSMIPERVLLEMAKPIIHHRTKEFESVLAKVRNDLKLLFQTKNDVILMATTGSGMMEASVVNFFSPGDKVLCVVTGKFGERWSEQAKRFGLNVVDYVLEPGQACDLNAFEKLLKTHKPKGVFSQACETSTGVVNPLKEMAKAVDGESLFIVDAITALGISDIRTDEWGLDVVITGSQKALMLPPGLAMVSLNDKAKSALKLSTIPKYYFDFQKELKFQTENTTHFTPAISLIRGLSVSLDMMKEEGFSNLFKRHARLAEATRAGVIGMGLELFAKAPSDSITAVKSPDGIDGSAVVSQMQKKYNVTIIGGQDSLKKKIFRLGHMGYCGDFDVLAMIAATEMTLIDLGHKVSLGSGISASLKVIQKGLQ